MNVIDFSRIHTLESIQREGNRRTWQWPALVHYRVAVSPPQSTFGLACRGFKGRELLDSSPALTMLNFRWTRDETTSLSERSSCRVEVGLTSLPNFRFVLWLHLHLGFLEGGNLRLKLIICCSDASCSQAALSR